MIEEILNKGLVAQAFDLLRQRSAEYPGEGYGDRLDSLQTEFKYMSDFMMQGYKDEGRARLFSDLLVRIQELYYDLEVRKELLDNPYVKAEVKNISLPDRSVETIRQMLRDTAGKPEHYKVLSDAFLSLLASGHWRAGAAEEWAAFLSSPDTAPFDAATLVPAVMMSAYCVFSPQKAECLAMVYRNATAEIVRQRAFVGVLLVVAASSANREGDVPGMAGIFQKVFSSPTAIDELLEMQVQMKACANAEEEGMEIQKRIIPDIMRGQSLRFTRNGSIEEREEERDCINLDAEEKRMEAMSDGVNKMLEMQKNGSDIFFMGFKQMKRFPFFHKIANWFMPFSIDHPDIAKAAEPLRGQEFIGKITEKGPFCESDKYSFVIALSDVLGRLPEDVRKMMEAGEIGPMGMNAAVLPTSSAIRLQYLQDLYRYFKLSPLGSTLESPFASVAHGCGLCLCAREFLTDSARRSVFTMMSRDLDAAAPGAPWEIILSFEDRNSFEYLSCCAENNVRDGDYDMAVEAYARCLKLRPQHPAMMRGMARACYKNREYAKAAFYYDALHTLFPKRVSYVLNYLMAMVMDGMAADVVNEAYRLEYENPGDVAVRNLLGWVLLNAGKAEQALAVYERLLPMDKVAGNFEIMLNAFYAQLFNGRAQQAVEVMEQYGRTQGEMGKRNLADKVSLAMKDDDALMRRYSIGEAERAIILSRLAFLTP